MGMKETGVQFRRFILFTNAALGCLDSSSRISLQTLAFSRANVELRELLD